MASPHLLQPLQQILGDRYEILRQIGGGGMAEVFLARHRRHGRLFAVKVLSQQLSGDPAVVARFTEEARTAATLGGHPNIGEIFDIGDGNGLHYLVMPYVDGEDLSSYLKRRGRLSVPEALEVMCQVTDALVWAGERNVVHRDLKPSNIRIDRAGRAILLDFGISKATDVPSGLTRAGETLGTPYYMSPEQIKGETCDARSDLYSLGIVLFEMLSGRKPFTGDTLRAIELAHVQSAPPPLSGLVPGIDPRLELMVNKLLRKNPSERYQSAGELLRDVRSAIDEFGEAKLEPAVETGRPNANTQVETLTYTAARGAAIPRWLIPALAAALAVAAIVIFLLLRKHSLPERIALKAGTMLLVPAGQFIFGSDDPESPNKRQQLSLPAFYVDATEVSNAQYAKFIGSTGHQLHESESFRNQPDLPVAGVTLDEAKSYCAWVGGRLPTEQEWEKAARGADGRIYPWGDNPLPHPGNLVAVTDFVQRRSPYHALNMSGNVFEWTASAFPVTDRELEDMRKLTGANQVSRIWANIKGGSFLIKDDRFLRLYMRRGWPADQASPAIGFRCVKDAN